ncbi:MAG: hypothetical protein HN348_21285, partial [Proteobacteria bacterium]|nr:hypothetical protein [Pseudomonadota bacterium]
MNLQDQSILRDGLVIPLPGDEGKVLSYLAQNPGQLIRGEELEQAIPSIGPEGGGIGRLIRRLRRKLEADQASPTHLLTVDGGYRFEPLATSTHLLFPTCAPLGNLPARPVVLGRDTLLDQLQQLTNQHRVVGLWGPPGIGKTAVAIAMAHRLDKAIYCSVEGMSDSAEISAALARFSVEDSLEPLLVLDHAGDTGTIATEILQQKRLLVVSRDPLPIAQTNLELGPLDTDFGVALLRHLGNKHANAEEIAKSFAGHPQALELAAAIPTLNLALPDKPLSDPLGAAIDQLWRSLSLAEQEVLLQATVFRGGFSVEAAQLVIQLDDDSPTLLTPGPPGSVGRDSSTGNL